LCDILCECPLGAAVGVVTFLFTHIEGYPSVGC